MKKIIHIFLLASLLLSLTLTGHAAQTEARLADVTAQPGEVVHMLLQLPDGIRGDAVGITYTCDADLLERLPGESVWCKKGVLKDFSTSRSEGVWAAPEAMDLSGDCCILSFRIREDVSFTRTQVSCTVIVKNGAQQSGSYTVTGTVSTPCEHSYGQWKTAGMSGHVQTCEKCGGTMTASHQWGEPTEAVDPEDSAVTIRTIACTVCEESWTETIRSDILEILPTYPAATEATQPQPETFPAEEPTAEEPFEEEPFVEKPSDEKPTIPTEAEKKEPQRHEATKQTEPVSVEKIPASSQNNPASSQNKPANEPPKHTEPQLPDYNRPEPSETGSNSSGTGFPADSSHNHSHEEQPVPASRETRPMVIPIEGDAATDPAAQNGPFEIVPRETEDTDHDHDHDHVTPPAHANPVSVITAAAAVAALLAALVFFLRKKRR